MALDVPPLMNAFFEEGDEFLVLLFSMMDQTGEIPEPQLANLMKFL